MIVLLLLVPLSIGLAVCFLAAFIWAVRSGQYEDTETPSMRALMDEPSPTLSGPLPKPNKNWRDFDKKRVVAPRDFPDL